MNKLSKKVIFVTGSLTDGGAERVISILASGCAEIGAQVSVVALREKEITYQISKKVNLIQIKTRSNKLKNFERIFKLHKILKDSDAQAIICFLPIITLYTLIANIGVNKKIISSERGDPYAKLSDKNVSFKDKVANLFIRKMKMLCASDYIVFQTSDAQNYYGKRALLKSTVIPNPIDTTALPKPYEGVREPVVVAAGRFSEEKNFPMLIEAFAEFHTRFPQYTLELYGQGKLKDSYETLIKNLGLQNAVKMPGFVSDLPERMRTKAMYVSSSNHEGISNSMLEALGMGVPTIVTDCPVGGSKMFVQTDINGILIPMNDVNSLTNAMLKIAGDEMYSRIISQTAVRIRRELNTETISNRWLELV